MRKLIIINLDTVLVRHCSHTCGSVVEGKGQSRYMLLCSDSSHIYRAGCGRRSNDSANTERVLVDSGLRQVKPRDP